MTTATATAAAIATTTTTTTTTTMTTTMIITIGKRFFWEAVASGGERVWSRRTQQNVRKEFPVRPHSTSATQPLHCMRKKHCARETVDNGIICRRYL